MTTQVPDSCTFQGRRWVIESWSGDRECVPESRSLGFKTVTQSTANWEGRVDHFLIHRGRLMLFKIEVALPEKDRGVLLPLGSRRELLTRFDKMGDETGGRVVQVERRFEFLVFDNLWIRLTGSLLLTYSYFDYWESPWPIEDDDEETLEEMELEFEDGELVDVLQPQAGLT